MLKERTTSDADTTNYFPSYTTTRRKSLESLQIPRSQHFSARFGSVEDLWSSPTPQPTDFGLDFSCITNLLPSKPSLVNSTHSTEIENPHARLVARIPQLSWLALHTQPFRHPSDLPKSPLCHV